jgi:hypothetical protein
MTKMSSRYYCVPLCLSAFVAVSKFIQIIGQISRLRCASLEMTTKWIPAHKPPILPNLSTIYNLFMQNKANFRKSQVDVKPLVIMNYERNSDWTLGENEPKTNPIKANFRKNECKLLRSFRIGAVVGQKIAPY